MKDDSAPAVTGLAQRMCFPNLLEREDPLDVGDEHARLDQTADLAEATGVCSVA